MSNTKNPTEATRLAVDITTAVLEQAGMLASFDERATQALCNLLAEKLGTMPELSIGRVTEGAGWKVRERRDAEGKLLDCFVEAPREYGMAYGLQVLGDDYTGYGDVERKLDHCHLIVALVNNLPTSTLYSQPTDVAKRMRHHSTDLRLPQDVRDLLVLGGSETERFYGGMCAWKRTAQQKDDRLIVLNGRVERLGKALLELAEYAARETGVTQREAVAGPIGEAFSVYAKEIGHG